MAKYEDTLILEYKELDSEKKELIKNIDNAAWRIFQVRGINSAITKTSGIWYKWVFMTKKIKQLVRVEKKAQDRFKKLAKEFWPIDERMTDIRNVLFKYYDKEIEECVHSLRIEGVHNITDLLTLYNGKLLEHFEDTDSEA